MIFKTVPKGPRGSGRGHPTPRGDGGLRLRGRRGRSSSGLARGTCRPTTPSTTSSAGRSTTTARGALATAQPAVDPRQKLLTAAACSDLGDRHADSVDDIRLLPPADAGERRGPPGRADRGHGLLRGRADRLLLPPSPRSSRATSSRRARREESACSSTRPGSSKTATSWRSRSTAWDCSATRSARPERGRRSMTLHRLTTLTLGVPDPARWGTTTRSRDPAISDGRFRHGQLRKDLRLVQTGHRGAVAILGCHDPMILHRVGDEPVCGARVSRRRGRRGRGRGLRRGHGRARCASRSLPRIGGGTLRRASRSTLPGDVRRRNLRSEAILRDESALQAALALGHMVHLSPSSRTGRKAFFVDGLGFKVSDSASTGGPSCAARPTTTTSPSARRRCRSPTTGPGRSPTSTRSARRRTVTEKGDSERGGARPALPRARTTSGTSRTRPATHRVLRRHGQSPRRTSSGSPRSGRAEVLLLVGSAAAEADA